ncbi:MAG: low specificity L-threonine aldolase [Alphaproteobacteria bacterium]|nr:low specificity L-threonine aldolase [Alphaproteobacteria bacterium]
MYFKSDNTSPICPEMMQAIIDANNGYFTPYGADDLSLKLKSTYSDVFETNVTIFPVLTGSAANCLALSVITPPYGIIYAHSESHIYTDECGAPGFYTRGAKIEPIEGEQGKICPNELKKRLSKAGFGNVHASQPAMVTVTQLTELGTIYSLDELKEISDIAHFYGLPVHMDGARFANAVATLNVSSKKASLDSGIDILSLGATKNGAMAAEAVLFFNEAHVKDFAYRQKNAGHLISKMRFVSAQLLAYVKDDLWLRNAEKANFMAQKLSEGLVNSGKAKILYPVQGNELFVEMDHMLLCHLEAKGAQFYRWSNADSTIIRLVTSFSTNLEDVHQFLNLVHSF